MVIVFIWRIFVGVVKSTPTLSFSLISSKYFQIILSGPLWSDCFESMHNRACKWVSHNKLFWDSQTHSLNDSIYNFDWVFLEIPVRNCIAGMLLTCHISSAHWISLLFLFTDTRGGINCWWGLRWHFSTTIHLPASQSWVDKWGNHKISRRIEKGEDGAVHLRWNWGFSW